MPNALTYLIGGDSTPFAQEMKKMEAIAAASSRSIAGRMAAESHAGFSGIIRETVTIFREAARGGGIGRILGSSTILIGYLAQLSKGTQEAGNAAAVAAEAYDLLAMRQANAAAKSIQLASAAEEAFLANESATEADLTGAIAAREKAIADERSAIALRAKALAATNAAEAEAAEAAVAGASAGAGLLGAGASLLVTGIIAVGAAALVVYERFWGIKAAIDGAAMEIPKLADEYVPRLARHSSDAAKSQREIAEAAAQAREEFEGAAAQAERQSKILQEQYTHLRKLNDLHKETELARAHTPAERQAIEARYAQQNQQLLRQQHQDELAAMDVEAANLKREETSAIARKKVVNSAEEDAEISRKLQINKKTAEAFMGNAYVWKEYKRELAEQFGGAFRSDADKKQIRDSIAAAEAGGTATAQKYIQEANDWQDKSKANDLIRKENERLQQQANRAAAERERIIASRSERAGQFQTEEQNAAEEDQAREELEAARQRHRGSRASSSVSESQRIGFSWVAPAAGVSIERYTRETSENTKELVRIMGQHGHSAHHHQSMGHSSRVEY